MLRELAIRGLEALVLFGSRARGDFDEMSDVDVAAFGEASSTSQMVDLKRSLQNIIDERINLSLYSKHALELMAQNGSLFLWHLKLEGKVLWKKSNWFETVLLNAKPYGRDKGLNDLSTFLLLLDEVAVALETSERTLYFEVSTIYTVLRTAGMIVSGVIGHPCFTRTGSIHYLKTLLQQEFTLNCSEVTMLYDSKLYYTGRKASKPVLDVVHCQAMVLKAKNILVKVRRILDEHPQSISS